MNTEQEMRYAPVMHRAQLIPLRLNQAQRLYMAKAAGTARFAYNWALAEWKRQAKEWWDSGKVAPYPTAFSLQKQFNAIKEDQFPWIREVAGRVTEGAIFQVGDAVAAFRDGLARYPRFRVKGGRSSFVASPNRREFRIDGKHIVLPRVGRVRLGADVRWPDAPAIRAVVSHRAGKWYVAVNFELPPLEPIQRTAASAGVDLGITTPLVVASEGVTLQIGAGLAERIKVERRKLRRANKRLHRRVKGSGRRRRAQQLVARVQQRIADIRSDVQHKATHQIAGMAARIGLETLAVRNMLQNGRLARAIADVGFFEIKRQLKYKADEVVEADRWFPSSKTCSACGSVKRELKLSDRTYRCECGFECDRDVNAARNLEKMAANCAVSARGDGSPARRRKLTLSSLSMKREAKKSAGGKAQLHAE